jgi:polysaccharide pyruvyl transferase WcaK-like protein
VLINNFFNEEGRALSPVGAYIGWVGHENLGDEAMFAVCQRVLPAVQWNAVDYEEFASRRNGLLRPFARLLRRKHAAWDGAKIQQMTPDFALLGGGTTINQWEATLYTYRELRRITGRPIPVFGTGVQAPGFWPSAIRWRDSRKAWARALSELPMVGVRGPESECLLREAGLSNVMVTGDPCVLLHKPLVQARPASSPLNLVLNLGSTRLIWGDHGRFLKEMIQFASEAKLRGWSLSLLPVYPKDREICDLVAFKAGLRPASILPLASTEAKFFQSVSSADVLVAFKLHAGILSAAANIPFVMLEYRPKCRDFTSSIGWEEFTISTSTVTADQLVEAVRHIAVRRVLMQKYLCSAMCQLRSKFESYCRNMQSWLPLPEIVSLEASPHTRSNLRLAVN